MTKTEMRILETLWKSEPPLCAGEILEQNPDIKEVTLRTALKNMLKKDFISVDGMIQRTKNYARTCTLLREETFSIKELEILKEVIEEKIQL